MYDTIKGSLSIDKTHYKQLTSLLESMQSSTVSLLTSNKTYSGNIENLRIKINENSVRFDGSLSKFLNGERSTIALDLETTKRAIEKFTDLTHLPMNLSRISRLDFAQNLTMKYPATSYFPCFGESKYLQRLESGTGLYYRNRIRELVFYDKAKELSKTKTTTGPITQPLNLLRFEVRLMRHKNICKYFKVSDVRLERLYEPSFYQSVVNAWVNEYNKIEKYYDIPLLFNDNAYREPSLFCKQIIYQGINAMGGYGRVLSLIKQAKSRQVFANNDQYNALMRKVRSLNKIDDLTVENNLINELRTKVMDIQFLAA